MFEAKNRLRKEHHKPGDRAHLAARKKRRDAKGAFGRASANAWNDMIAGTSGVRRSVGSSGGDSSEGEAK
jgi:hypothetical protein